MNQYPKIDAVLVRTEYASNVGAAARAMANLGGSRLILVDPKCEITSSKARQAAAGAQEQLAQHIRYDSWEHFYNHEPEGLRIGLTRRAGKKRPVVPLDTRLTEFAKDENSEVQRIYLIFGPEADGLGAEDVTFVHDCCHLPVFGDFASYNLAQAVLLSLYITRQALPPAVMPKQTTSAVDTPEQPFYFPDVAIKEWLTAMGFDINARRSSAYLTLKRLFLQKLPTKHEMQVLDAILQQNIRKLRGN